MTTPAPIFVISRFRSGSSFLWNLFRRNPAYCCFYEPLHDNLVESVELDQPAMESHRGIKSYWDEYRAIAGDLPAVHRPQFGVSDLFLRPADRRPELAQYLKFLVRAAAREGKTCVIKCNRLDFRLPWLREQFPEAKVLYILRNPRDQWISSVRPHKPELWDRLEENRGYDLPAWISSLAPTWPFLLEGPTRPAYYYSYLLWKLSKEFGERHADLCLDFDRDVADEPDNLTGALASFFPEDFFQQPEVRALIKPSRPGIWRKYRTEEWFKELEAQAEATLRQAGVYKPAFWRWPATPRADAPDALPRAIDLALLMFSRHRADLLVHGHQLQRSLDSAKKYAESLSSEYEKSRDTLKTSESHQRELDSKHRLLQAVYDSLKQAHDISITSLTKTLEEFQFATKELRQLIAYKDAQLLQLADRTAEVQKSLTDSKAHDRQDELAGQLAEARQVEQTLRQELETARISLVQQEGAAQVELAEARATLDRLRGELAGVNKEANEAKTLKRHAVALEITSAETWTALVAARKDLAARDVSIQTLHDEARSRQGSAQAQAETITALRNQLEQEAAAKAALSGSLAESHTALTAARVELDSHLALKVHRDALERANHEGWRRIVEQREQLARLAVICETLEGERAAQGTLLEARARQIDELTTQMRQLEERVAQLDQELAGRLSALDSAQAAGRQLTGDLAGARQQIGLLEANAVAEAQRRTELQSALHSAQEKREAMTQQSAALTRELLSEKAARTSEKAAYDQRSATHVNLLKETHHMLSAEKARWNAREEEHRQQVAALHEQLSAAQTRLTALDQSWASGLIQRLAPAAFKPSNAP